MRFAIASILTVLAALPSIHAAPAKKGVDLFIFDLKRVNVRAQNTTKATNKDLSNLFNVLPLLNEFDILNRGLNFTIRQGQTLVKKKVNKANADRIVASLGRLATKTGTICDKMKAAKADIVEADISLETTKRVALFSSQTAKLVKVSSKLVSTKSLASTKKQFDAHLKVCNTAYPDYHVPGTTGPEVTSFISNVKNNTDSCSQVVATFPASAASPGSYDCNTTLNALQGLVPDLSSTHAQASTIQDSDVPSDVADQILATLQTFVGTCGNICQKLFDFKQSCSAQAYDLGVIQSDFGNAENYLFNDASRPLPFDDSQKLLDIRGQQAAAQTLCRRAFPDPTQNYYDDD